MQSLQLHARLCALVLLCAVAQPAAAYVPAIAMLFVQDEIESLIAAGETEQAIERIKARISDAPTREDYLILADLYVHSGAGLAAEAAIDRARALGADYAVSALTLAKAKLLQQQYQSAIETLKGLSLSPADRAQAFIIRADAAFALGDVAAAERQYEEARALEPNNFEPVLGLARVALRAGALVKADRLAKQALSLSNNNSMAHYTLGLVARYRGEAVAARNSFKQAIDAFADNALARLELVALELDSGNLAVAEQQLDIVFEITRSNPRARYLSAVIMAFKGDYEDAHQLLNNLRSITDRYLPAAYVRGMVAYQVQRNDIAQEYLNKVLQARPNSRKTRLALASVEIRLGRPQIALDVLAPLIYAGSVDAEALSLAGAAAARAGDGTLSEAYIARAEQLGVVAGSVAQPDIRSKLALAQVSAGDFGAAITTLSTLVASERADIRHLGILADVQLRSGDLQAAKSTAERLATLAPQRGLAYNILGTIAHKKRDYSNAIQQYTKALKRNKRYYTALRNRGLAHLAVGDVEAAEADLEALLRAKPEDARAKAALGRAKLLLGKYDLAVSLFEAASRALPSEPDLLVDLVVARARAGYTAQAIRESRLVMRRVGERPDLLKKMGLLFLDIGQPKLAAPALARYQAYYPRQFEASLLHGRALFEAGLITGSRLYFERAKSVASGEKEHQSANWYLFAVDVNLGDQTAALAKLPRLDMAARPKPVSPALVADVYLIVGQYDRALTAYKELFKQDKSADVSIGFARTMWQLDRRSQAIDILIESSRSSSVFEPKLAQTLAEYYLQLDKSLEAQLALERLIAETGGNPDTLMLLAGIYLETGNADAVRVAEQAYLIAPNDPAILSGFGWVLLQGVRDIERAFVVLEKAAKREPGNALYRYRLGMAQLARGNDLFARDSLKAALSLDPNFEFAESARQTLEDL